MNEEITKALESLRASVGVKNTEAAARIDAIEESAKTRAATEKQLRADIDALKEDIETQRKAIDEAKRKARQQALASDPVSESRRAIEILGMQVRAALAAHVRQDLPERFRPETEHLRSYNEQRNQRATLHAGSDAAGGYLVPTVAESELIDTVEEVSDLVGETDFQPGLPGPMDIPTLLGRPAFQHKRATVDTDMTVSSPSFGQMQFRPDEGYVFFPVDNMLLEMSAINLGLLSQTLIRDSVIEALAHDLVVADGSAAYNEITGILAEATAAYITRLPSGKKAFNDLAAMDLYRLRNSLLKRGRARGKWLMSHEILGLIIEFDRTGKERLLTVNNAGEYLLLQRPIVHDEDMPDLADSGANKTFMGFGDLATYLVGLVGGIKIAVSNEVFFNRNQTAFRGVINFQIKRKPVKTFGHLRTATS